MSWVRIDDGLPEHRKVFFAASRVGVHGFARVIAVWLQGTCYASRSLTDGFLPIDVVKRFHDARPLQVAEALVSANLWTIIDGGFQVHDYHVYNPLASDVKEKRSRDASRKRQGTHEDSARNPALTREGDVQEPGEVISNAGGGVGEPSPVHMLITHYHDSYLARFREKPNIDGRKDGAILKRLASTHGVDMVRGRIDRMLDSTDDFIAKSGRTIGILKACWNKLGNVAVVPMNKATASVVEALKRDVTYD